MPGATIGVDNDRANGVIVLTPLGRLDSGQIEKLDDVIKARLREGCEALVIDFAATVFIASSGLRTLLLAHRAISASGGSLALCGMSPNLYSVFKVSGFHRVFKIVGDRQEAVVFARPANHVSPVEEQESPRGDPPGVGAGGETVPERESASAPEMFSSVSGGRRRRRSRAAPARRRRSGVLDEDQPEQGFVKRFLIRVLQRVLRA